MMQIYNGYDKKNDGKIFIIGNRQLKERLWVTRDEERRVATLKSNRHALKKVFDSYLSAFSPAPSALTSQFFQKS